MAKHKMRALLAGELPHPHREMGSKTWFWSHREELEMIRALKMPWEAEPEDAVVPEVLRESEMSIRYWQIQIGFPLPLFPSPQVKPLARATSETMEQKNTSVCN